MCCWEALTEACRTSRICSTSSRRRLLKECDPHHAASSHQPARSQSAQQLSVASSNLRLARISLKGLRLLGCSCQQLAMSRASSCGISCASDTSAAELEHKLSQSGSEAFPWLAQPGRSSERHRHEAKTGEGWDLGEGGDEPVLGCNLPRAVCA
eukprot:754106-Hanusia_phi.AAC.3